MTTKQNATSNRGAEVIRSPGKATAHYMQVQTPQGSNELRVMQCKYQAGCAYLAELEHDRRQFARLAGEGSHEALKALAQVQRQIASLRKQTL